MKPETEEAIQAVRLPSKFRTLAAIRVLHIHHDRVLTESTQAKGLLMDLVVVASLVRTLTDSFGSASDLYRKLKRKSNPKDSDDEDDKLFIRKSFHRRRDSGVGKDACDSEEELIFTSSIQVRAEYDRGYKKHGELFARGDSTTQIQLQSQIIQLQQVLLSIHQDMLVSSYLAPSSSHSHLVRLIQTTRTARAASIAALSMQYERMIPPPSPKPRQPESPCSPPGAFPAMEDVWHTTKPFKPRRRSADSSSSSSLSGDKEIRILPIPNRKPDRKPAPEPEPKPQPKPEPEPELKPRPKLDTRPSFPPSKPRLFCLYAKDLQDDPWLPLAKSYRPCGDNKCPFCRTYLSMRPGKVWEIVVDNCKEPRSSHRKSAYRVFRIKNRFIVKSHREQGGFACVLCARFRRFDMLCRDIGSLIDHLWREHTADELEWDIDVVEC
ncbi:hypothetical protein ACJBU6_10129 [Exserohilum turcicum]